MEKIEPGKYVELGYDLYEVTPEGEKLVHQTSADDPEKIVFGVTRGMIVPLEKAIEGLGEGGEFDHMTPNRLQPCPATFLKWMANSIPTW